MSTRYIFCEACFCDVPVAPGHFNVSVPHVVSSNGCTVTNAYAREHFGKPCHGNEKRRWRDDLVHVAIRLAQQYATLDDDAYWEGL